LFIVRTACVDVLCWKVNYLMSEACFTAKLPKATRVLAACH